MLNKIICLSVCPRAELMLAESFPKRFKVKEKIHVVLSNTGEFKGN